MKEVSISFLKDGNYKDYIESINNSDADYIHFDVMDGKFVPKKNLLLNDLTKYLSLSKKKNDVHLMVEKPEKYIELLSSYNIEYLTIHKEIKNYDKYLNQIKNCGFKTGLAINPETKPEDIYPDLDKINLVLVMGVHPGESGQTFIDETTNKINKLNEEIKKRNLNTKIAVDGGIKEETLDKITNTNIIVSSSYLLNNLDKINQIKNCN